jgi:cytoskeletal protein CcmA (bactofilin family)
MWRRTSESKAPLSSPQPPAPPAQAPFERPAPPEAPRPSAESRPVKTLLGRGLALKGELSGREDVSIDGVFEGQIHVSGAGVTIGANGRVSAEVEADEIIVEGRMEGNLHARERVILRRSANVNGNIETQRLLIEDGAIFRGRVEMARPGEVLSTTCSTGAAAARTERAAFGRVPVEATETAS